MVKTCIDAAKTAVGPTTEGPWGHPDNCWLYNTINEFLAKSYENLDRQHMGDPGYMEKTRNAIDDAVAFVTDLLDHPDKSYNYIDRPSKKTLEELVMEYHTFVLAYVNDFALHHGISFKLKEKFPALQKK